MRILLAIVVVVIIASVSLIQKCIELNHSYYENRRKNCYSEMTKTLKFDDDYARKWCSSD